MVSLQFDRFMKSLVDLSEGTKQEVKDSILISLQNLNYFVADGKADDRPYSAGEPESDHNIF